MIGYNLRRRTGKKAGASASFPLDDFPVPLVCVSTARQLVAGFANDYPMQVRRSSDGAVQFIPFSSGLTDSASILSFVGGGNGSTYTLRDQSGNSRHFLQLDSTKQPQIVNAGSLRSINGHPAVYVTGSEWMRFSGAITSVALELHHFAVVHIVSAGGSFRRLFSWTKNAGSDFSDMGFMVAHVDGSSVLYGWENNANSSQSGVTPGSRIVTLRNTPNQMVVGSNGSDGSTLISSYPGFNQWTELTLFGSGMPTDPSSGFAGFLGEYIVFDGILTSPQADALRADMSAFWGIS